LPGANVEPARSGARDKTLSETSTSDESGTAAETPELILSIGEFTFAGRFEWQSAPKAVAWLIDRLPLSGSAFHARWSGEAAWMPLNVPVNLDLENGTAYPRPGQVLLYAGGRSEPELLIPYGACAFASRSGQLSGSHVITLSGDDSHLSQIGSALLTFGAQPLRLEALAPSCGKRRPADGPSMEIGATRVHGGAR